jgi:hypothetical protein
MTHQAITDRTHISATPAEIPGRLLLAAPTRSPIFGAWLTSSSTSRRPMRPEVLVLLEPMLDDLRRQAALALERAPAIA